MRPPRVAVLALVLVAACTAEAPPPADAQPRPAERAVPADARGFLTELLPGTGGDVLVVHRLEGPEGIGGSLEILARPGGRRRENWTVRIPVAGGRTVERSATVLVGPEGIVATASDGTRHVRRLPLAAWAAAFARAPADERRRIVASVRAFHRQVAEARRGHPGTRRTVAGTDCLWLRVAAQTVCLWEEAGIPLRYEGPLVAAEAVRVDRAPAFSADAFDLPEIPADAPVAAGFADLAQKPPEAVLAALAEGDPDVLSRIAVPGLRPPSGLFEVGADGAGR